MLSANKSLLLLATCALLAFACTSSKKKPQAPTPPVNAGQGSDAERKLNDLEGQLNTLVGKITALQASAGKGDVSQTDFGQVAKRYRRCTGQD